MLGEYRDSGFKQAPYLARRADGQVLQLPRLLYLVAENADGRRNYEQIAQAVTQGFGRGVSEDNVRVLVDSKLRPLGVLAAPDGSSPRLSRPNPLLALNFKTAVIPPQLVNAVTIVFRPFFWPLVALLAVTGFLALDWWLFFVHGIAQGLRHLINEPVFFLMAFGLVVLSAAFHECGHATGCRYGGARPGVMGVGIYLVWPAFYTDVTDAYRLGKGGRLRTDFGGVYFNALFMVAALGIYLLTHFEVLIAVIVLLQFEMIHQFLPFLRLDGYYVIADPREHTYVVMDSETLLNALEGGAGIVNTQYEAKVQHTDERKAIAGIPCRKSIVTVTYVSSIPLENDHVLVQQKNDIEVWHTSALVSSAATDHFFFKFQRDRTGLVQKAVSAEIGFPMEVDLVVTQGSGRKAPAPAPGSLHMVVTDVKRMPQDLR